MEHLMLFGFVPFLWCVVQLFVHVKGLSKGVLLSHGIISTLNV